MTKKNQEDIDRYLKGEEGVDSEHEQ